MFSRGHFFCCRQRRECCCCGRLQKSGYLPTVVCQGGRGCWLSDYTYRNQNSYKFSLKYLKYNEPSEQDIVRDTKAVAAAAEWWLLRAVREGEAVGLHGQQAGGAWC